MLQVCIVFSVRSWTWVFNILKLRYEGRYLNRPIDPVGGTVFVIYPPETNISAPENRPLGVRRFLLETIMLRGYVMLVSGRNLWFPKLPREIPACPPAKVLTLVQKPNISSTSLSEVKTPEKSWGDGDGGFLLMLQKSGIRKPTVWMCLKPGSK